MMSQSDLNNFRKIIQEELEPIKVRLDALESRMHKLEGRMDKLVERMDELEKRMDALAIRMDQLEIGFVQLEERLDDRIDGFYTMLNESFSDSLGIISRRIIKNDKKISKLNSRTKALEFHVGIVKLASK